MAFQNLLDTLGLPVLTLPVGDKVYEIPEVSADTFVRLVAINENLKTEPHPDAELFTLAIGEDLYQRMHGELTESQMKVVGITAWFWQLRLHDFAEEFWNSGGKALEGLVPTRTPTPRKTPTGAATTTRRRASGSGTSTRRNSNTTRTG